MSLGTTILMAKEKEYEDSAKEWKANLERSEAFYYSILARKDEFGKEGKRNGIYVTSWALKEKIGLDGILSALESQAEQSLEAGNGLNYSLETVISTNAQNFIESLHELRIKDIAPYVNSRLGDTKLEERYGDKTLKELQDEKSSKDEKEYAHYIIVQVQNAVMAKMSTIGYQERAKRLNQEYSKAHPAPAKSE